jgi:hypothetical protein
MRALANHTAPAKRKPLVEWILQRDTRAITCQLDVRGRETYEVCVLPHWDPSSAVIERFDAATPALLRHAQLACRLREAGWTVIDHVSATYPYAA